VLFLAVTLAERVVRAEQAIQAAQAAQAVQAIQAAHEARAAWCEEQEDQVREEGARKVRASPNRAALRGFLFRSFLLLWGAAQGL